MSQYIAIEFSCYTTAMSHQVFECNGGQRHFIIDQSQNHDEGYE